MLPIFASIVMKVVSIDFADALIHFLLAARAERLAVGVRSDGIHGCAVIGNAQSMKSMPCINGQVAFQHARSH